MQKKDKSMQFRASPAPTVRLAENSAGADKKALYANAAAKRAGERQPANRTEMNRARTQASGASGCRTRLYSSCMRFVRACRSVS